MVVDFNYFEGLGVLNGVDFGTVGDGYDQANTCTFIWNGKAYRAQEDPSDGYRSCLASIEQLTDSKVDNTFPQCLVRGEGMEGNTEGIKFIDIVTGKVVLELGTDNYDDYYPYYVANFDPTAMAINKDR